MLGNLAGLIIGIVCFLLACGLTYLTARTFIEEMGIWTLITVVPAAIIYLEGCLALLCCTVIAVNADSIKSRLVEMAKEGKARKELDNLGLDEELSKLGIQSWNWDITMIDERLLGTLAGNRPALAIAVFRQGLGHKDPEVRAKAAHSLGILSTFSLELFLDFYRKGLGDRHPKVRYNTATTIWDLVPVSPELAADLYRKEMNDKDSSIRAGAAIALRPLAQVNPRLAAELYGQGIKDDSENVRREAGASLAVFAEINPELAANVYEQGLAGAESCVRESVLESLEYLIIGNPEAYRTVCEYGIDDEAIRKAIATRDAQEAAAAKMREERAKNAMPPWLQGRSWGEDQKQVLDKGFPARQERFDNRIWRR